jgi:class II aldolase/adducin N-terminal domain-containing protein
VNLAAAYRLVALHGWDDLTFTHVSARVPGSEHHFLINPYGMMFEEITASSLVKIDLGGRKTGIVRPLPGVLMTNSDGLWQEAWSGERHGVQRAMREHLPNASCSRQPVTSP